MNHCVRSWWKSILLLLRDFPEIRPCVEKIESLIRIRDLYRVKIFKKHLSFRFSDLNVRIQRIQKILNIVQIYLIVTQKHLKLFLRFRLLNCVNMCEDKPQRSWENPFWDFTNVSQHSKSVCLSTSSLPIAKINAANSVNCRANYRKRRIIEDLIFWTLWIKDSIKLKPLLEVIMPDENIFIWTCFNSSHFI